MGALGKFADTNLAATAAASGGTWEALLPLANLLDASRYTGAPARCPDCTDLAKSQFDIVLAGPWAISLVGLMFHSMSLAAKYRLTGRAPGGTWGAPAFQTDWTNVYGRLYDSADLPWEAENWWTGQVTSDEIDLFKRHKFVVFEPQLVDAIRVELDDVSNADGFIDIGGLWVSSTFSPAVNYERGWDLGFETRSQQDEGPSGRLFTEERASRRVVTVNWDALTANEARRMYDAGARAGIGKTVIFIPDSDDEPGAIRGAFPAVFAKPPAPRFIYPTKNPVAATFREILA